MRGKGEGLRGYEEVRGDGLEKMAELESQKR